MNKLRWLLLLSILLTGIRVNAQHKDSLTRAQFIKIQTSKADTLNQKALRLASSKSDLNQAIAYIMQGLHIYSRYRDTDGLRRTFDHLGLVYQLQKKYTQAKWFILQSNTLSRQRKDTLQIINSLTNLASVKRDIKDFKLADRDINEAHSLTEKMRETTRRNAVIAQATTDSTKLVSKQIIEQNKVIYHQKTVTENKENINWLMVSIILLFVLLLSFIIYRTVTKKK